MEKFIKYKRIDATISRLEIQGIFDQIIADGYEIISYSEKLADDDFIKINVIIIIGKKQVS